jgi:hypothetical protein
MIGPGPVGLTTMRRLFLAPLEDVAACLQQLAGTKRPLVALLATVVSLVVTWFVYVPVHELLHAAGCIVAGGTVTRLEIAPQYGGGLLAQIFDFVKSGGEYAGRLSGFDTHGSDVTYLATDVAPFVLSVVIGVPLVRLCGRRPRPMLLGTAIVLGLAPFYNVIGDYYEMGSIVLTRGATHAAAWTGGWEGGVAFEGLRSDDVFKLVGQIVADPDVLALEPYPSRVLALLLTAIGFGVGVLFAFVSYGAGSLWATVVAGRRQPMAIRGEGPRLA